ncbi:class I SAM-dependent methyltransferase [Candidatus Latescibacterota bacterium]
MENNAQYNHQQDSDVIPDSNSCILCGDISYALQISENTVFGKPYDTAFCENCELYYFMKQPTESFLNNYYEHEYFSSIRKSRMLYRLKSIFSAMRAFSQFLYIQKFTGGIEGKRILELGSADGTFLSFFKTSGWEIRGLETNEYMIRKAREKFGIVLEGGHITDIDPRNERYDIIALPHVIEHMPNPVEILSHCKNLLAESGILFIEVPYSPLPGETSPAELSEYLETTHLFNFRLSSLTKLVSKSGLEKISLDRFFYPVPGLFQKSSEFVGKTLMTGNLPGLNPFLTIPIMATALRMYSRYISKSDPLNRISLDSHWKGLGDSIRIVAGE